jgi:hypothetical protein
VMPRADPVGPRSPGIECDGRGSTTSTHIETPPPGWRATPGSHIHAGERIERGQFANDQADAAALTTAARAVA